MITDYYIEFLSVEPGSVWKRLHDTRNRHNPYLSTSEAEEEILRYSKNWIKGTKFRVVRIVTTVLGHTEVEV